MGKCIPKNIASRTLEAVRTSTIAKKLLQSRDPCPNGTTVCPLTGSAASVEGAGTARPTLPSSIDLQFVGPKLVPTTRCAQHTFPKISIPQDRGKSEFYQNSNIHLENKRSNLLPDIPGRNFRNLRLLE